MAFASRMAEVEMELLVEAAAFVTGVVLAVGAARIVLVGVLTATFGRRS